MSPTPNDPSDWDSEIERLTVQADYWRDIAAHEDSITAESAARMARLIEQHLRLLRQVTAALGDTNPGNVTRDPAGKAEASGHACRRPARRPGRGHRRTPVRSAVAEQLRRAEGWPLSTVEVCTRLARRQVGGNAVYAALRSLEGTGLCVRLRDTSALGSRAVYWCTPDSPFAAGWGDPR
jgi:hypothetical protein